MNINNLKVGQIFKNYKELCGVLEIAVKRGNSKPAQVKEIKRFFNYSQSVREITITEIYDKPLSKDENKRNTPVYIRYMELLLLQCLQSEQSKKLLVSNVKLAEKLKMIHSDYNEYYNKKYEISNILNVDLMYVHDFMGTTSNAYINTIKTILKRLESRSIILYETRWKTVEKKPYMLNGKPKEHIITRFASEKEKMEISKIRYELLQNYDGNMQSVYRQGKLNEFYKLYRTALQYRLGIDDAYIIFDITINQFAVETEYYKSMIQLLDEVEEGQLKIIINQMWSERNMKRLESKKENATIKSNNNEGLSNFEKGRLNSDFNDSMKILNNALITDGIEKHRIREH